MPEAAVESVREQAMDRLARESFNNRAFAGAYRKGFVARLDGEERWKNPYERDNYGPQGVTFSRAFWRRWNKGWDDADRYLEEHEP